MAHNRGSTLMDIIDQGMLVRVWPYPGSVAGTLAGPEHKRPVVAVCPEADEIVRTHAQMTRSELSGLDRRRIIFFCSACRHVHEASRAELRLG